MKNFIYLLLLEILVTCIACGQTNNLKANEIHNVTHSNNDSIKIYKSRGKLYKIPLDKEKDFLSKRSDAQIATDEDISNYLDNPNRKTEEIDTTAFRKEQNKNIAQAYITYLYSKDSINIQDKNITQTHKKIQDTFFGCSFRSSRKEVTEALRKKGYIIIKDTQETVIATDVTLGIYSFPYLICNFYHEDLYGCSFRSIHSTIQEANAKYNDLKKAIDGNYKGYFPIKEKTKTNDLIKGISYDDGLLDIDDIMRQNSVCLFIEKVELFYLVDLTYHNRAMLFLLQTELEQEL
ncbi:hypothetical protein EZS27_019653 [termite gut metagenome]|uniref:Uncharacterized protein n=1 Tax=termite gut metagenome TaxID=433724 RepID=A0A5J4RDK4_9ZZZZ